MDSILITNIIWRRAYLFVEYISNEPVSFFLKSSCGNRIPMECILLDGNKYRAKLNICTAGGRELLSAGRYRIMADDSYPDIDKNILMNIENYSRVYRYNGDRYSYIISFELSSENKQMILNLCSDYMMNNKKPNKQRPFFDGSDLLDKLKNIILYISRKLIALLYFIISVFKDNNGKNILFMSENHSQISDNMAAIDIRLKERGLNAEYKISYSFRNIFDKKHSVFSWFRLIARIAKSNFIFIDDYTPVFAYIKLRHCKLIQTWHAGFGFKLVGYGRFGIKGSPHPFISCHRNYSCGIIGCEELREIYSEVWGIEKNNLIASGMPRLEHFLDEHIIGSERTRLLKKYPFICGKTVILFAPTYRGYDRQGAYYDFDKIDFELFYNYAFKNNAVIIFKMHHFIKENVPIIEKYRNYIYEISDERINSLFYVTDVLITDYSSCFYDYSLLKKPMLFYAYDKDYYFATRGIHRLLETVAPGRICEDFDSLIKALENKDFNSNKPEEIFIDRAVMKDRLASDIIIDNIILKI